MQSKFTETNPRDFNPVPVPGLSADARKAVNAVFDAMSSWRTETINKSEEGIGQVIEKMSAAARALGWPDEIVQVTRAQMQGNDQNADSNHGSYDGCMGGADQIAERTIGYAVETERLAGLRRDRQLAKRGCFPKGSDEPLSALPAIRATVPEGLDRYGELLDEGGPALVVVIG